MNRSKRIYLVITNLFPSLNSFRGPYVYDQVKAIEKEGWYRVVVLKPRTWLRKEEDYVYEGIDVYHFTHYELPSNAWPGFGDLLSFRSLHGCLVRLGISFQDISIVHTHVANTAKYANYIKKINPKVVTVLQHHGYDVLQLTDGRFAEKKWHKKRCIRYGIEQCNNIDLHVGVSRKILKYLEDYKGIKLKNKYILYNGVDLNKFYPLKKYEENKTFTIGCIANFWKLKDQITLIKAVEILVKEGFNNIRVRFVGTGYTRNECEKYVQENSLHFYFEFNNEVDHTQLNSFYNTLDLFVLPSYWDSFGCVYTEAYACGIPFMTAKGTGVTELLPDNELSKWVIEPHDYKNLANNISRYMSLRYKQKLNSSIDIRVLIKEYLDYLDLYYFTNGES